MVSYICIYDIINRKTYLKTLYLIPNTFKEWAENFKSLPQYCPVMFLFITTEKWPTQEAGDDLSQDLNKCKIISEKDNIPSGYLNCTISEEESWTEVT